eukprot:Gb_21334 [translate_table: standard]
MSVALPGRWKSLGENEQAKFWTEGIKSWLKGATMAKQGIPIKNPSVVKGLSKSAKRKKCNGKGKISKMKKDVWKILSFTLNKLRAKQANFATKVEQRKKLKISGLPRANNNINEIGGARRSERLNAAQKERMRL